MIDFSSVFNLFYYSYAQKNKSDDYCPEIICLKANLNQHIHTILWLKHGIGYVYVTVDFLCIGWFELWAIRKKQELQNEKFLPTTGLEPKISGLLDWRSNRMCFLVVPTEDI